MLNFFKKSVPSPILGLLRPPYHYTLSFLAAVFYWFPSRKLIVIGVTGTNGKSTVVDLIHAILTEAGFKTGSISSLRFKIGDDERQNKLKMTMPGRFFLQKFLRDCVNAGCKYAVLEVTSEGIKQHRHKFIDFGVAAMTNVTPEHIESHGSFEKYLAAKLKLFELVSKNCSRLSENYQIVIASDRKKRSGLVFRLWGLFRRLRPPRNDVPGQSARILIVNSDDPNARKFLAFPAEKKYIYNSSFIAVEKNDKSEKKIIGEKLISAEGISFKIENTTISSKLAGEFNFYNLLAAISISISQNIDIAIIKKAIAKISGVPGRLEFIQKKPFAVVVDYAHTPDALRKVYETLHSNQQPTTNNRRLICVLGAAGGGRDKWKRPEMGKTAAEFCDIIILTNEDPYNEEPKKILEEIEWGYINLFNLKFSTSSKILDRREAIRTAIKSAKADDIVIITGKGAEPFIMGPNNTKIPWDDRKVVKEELLKLTVEN